MTKILAQAGWTVLFLVGVAALAFGFWMAWHPLGFIVGGTVVAIFGFGGGTEQMRKEAKRRP